MSAATTSAHLLLAQLTDSSFPNGAFSHSSGLEQAVRDGCVTTREDLAAFTESVLRLSVAPADAVTAADCARGAARNDLRAITSIDQRLHRMKPAI